MSALRREKQQRRVEQLLSNADSLRQDLASSRVITVSGESYAVDDLAQRFESHASDLAMLMQLQAELQEVTARLRRKGRLIREASLVIRKLAESLFRPGGPELARLGITVPKPAQRAVNVVAVSTRSPGGAP